MRQSKPFKVDKNGTKYYADYTCPRCGGQGGLDQWQYTGYTCFECGGSGRRVNPLIIKEYTPEYQAKLDERRAKREAEKLAKRIDMFNNNLPELLVKYGFNANGKIYVVLGNTYEIKDELRQAGAYYKNGVNWYFLEDNKAYPTLELDYTDCLEIYPKYGTMNWKTVTEIKHLIKEKSSTDNSPSNYVGEIGQRLSLELTFIHRYTYEIKSYSGWGTELVAINSFKDNEGNIFIWKSASAFFNAKDGDRLKVKGTVKEHSEYKGIKQTLLQRCKVEVV